MNDPPDSALVVVRLEDLLDLGGRGEVYVVEIYPRQVGVPAREGNEGRGNEVRGQHLHRADTSGRDQVERGEKRVLPCCRVI